MKHLVWFRSDLRISDNPALFHAAEKGPVIATYLLFPEQWQNHNDGTNKLWFWMRNLIELKKSLFKLNIPLIILKLDNFNDASEALLKLTQKLECETLWFNAEYGINERRRDKQVRTLFKAHALTCHISIDQTLFVPGSVLNKQGEYFKVFTPFRKHLYKLITPEQLSPLPIPKKQQHLELPSYPDIDIEQLYAPTASEADRLWKAGETIAHKKLNSFIEDKSSDYKKNRDIPAIKGTSIISPWLNTGVLSIRQCFSTALIANNGELDTGNDGLICWMSELIWREFYQHIIYGFPRVSMNKAFIVATDSLPWNHDSSLLAAWQNGKTGYPLVDAAMKQLVHTGWMHNRLRMVTAMFLTKNLMLDWRLGEAFFMQHLIDGDLAANNGGWQWSASTGTDAAPYFRMFNPVSQSQKFDPDGTFIRQWLPQLAHLDNKTIHEPWKSETLITDYSTPIIDHKASREKVLRTFKQLKAQE